MTVRVTRKRIAFLAVVAAAAASGVAFAAIPSADGTIHGCYQKENGQLRVAERASDCRSSELAITWNAKGVTGATGAAGPQGPTGDTGPRGSDGTSVTTKPVAAGSATCAAGGVEIDSAGAPLYVCNGQPAPCDDGRPGTDDVVTGGICTHVNKPVGAPCSPPDGGQADGIGGCAAPVPCDDGRPGTDDVIVGGVCVHINKAVGAPCSPPVGGQADGLGGCAVPVPCDDGLPGTDDVIVGGVCMHINKPVGAPCSPPVGGVADGIGNCVLPPAKP